MVTESGSLESGSVSGTMSLPSFHPQNVGEKPRLRLNPEEPLLENLYRLVSCVVYVGVVSLLVLVTAHLIRTSLLMIFKSPPPEGREDQ